MNKVEQTIISDSVSCLRIFGFTFCLSLLLFYIGFSLMIDSAFAYSNINLFFSAAIIQGLMATYITREEIKK